MIETSGCQHVALNQSKIAADMRVYVLRENGGVHTVLVDVRVRTGKIHVLDFCETNERRAHNQRFIKFMTEELIFAVKWYNYVSTRTLFNLVHEFFFVFSFKEVQFIQSNSLMVSSRTHGGFESMMMMDSSLFQHTFFNFLILLYLSPLVVGNPSTFILLAV